MGYETSVDVVELLLLLLLFVFPVLLLPIVLELASFIAGITDTTFCVGINCELSFWTDAAAREYLIFTIDEYRIK